SFHPHTHSPHLPSTRSSDLVARARELARDRRRARRGRRDHERGREAGRQAHARGGARRAARRRAPGGAWHPPRREDHDRAPQAAAPGVKEHAGASFGAPASAPARASPASARGSAPESALGPTSSPGERADGPLLALALAKLALQAAAITRYGYFRDELYYLVCAQHPAAGYVDQPPLSIWILGLVRAVLGDSLIAIRLLPALAGAATVFLTGRIARELGGGRFAQSFAALAAIVVPVFIGTDHYYSMNTFDILLW